MIYFLVQAATNDYDKEWWTLYLFKTKPEAQDYIIRLRKFIGEYTHNHARNGYYFDAETWQKLDPDSKIDRLISGLPNPYHGLIWSTVDYQILEVSVM